MTQQATEELDDMARPLSSAADAAAGNNNGGKDDSTERTVQQGPWKEHLLRGWPNSRSVVEGRASASTVGLRAGCVSYSLAAPRLFSSLSLPPTRVS